MEKHIKRGFTLIELLVVVLIISILAAVAVPQYQVAVAKARYTQLMVLADSLWEAEQLYHLANGEYTNNLADLDIELPAGNTNTSRDVRYSWGRCAIDALSSAKWVYCHNTDETLHYFRYVNQLNLRHCRAVTNNNTAHKVCLALGGQKESAEGGFTYYKLP